MKKEISVTGIKPTGNPHIGNYLGAIQPALELEKSGKYDSRYFIADYHALNTIKDGKRLKELTYEIAATWLAFGLDPEKTIFYKQSDLYDTFTLSTFLSAFTAKGLMNRAHAYKASVDKNRLVNKDNDFGVNIGLFTYPILMAADILQFNANLVPVGKDQVQHIEIAADIAQSINHNYKKELLTIPKALISEENKLVIGLDGRKMSKSYNNIIPLFLPPKKLRKLIMKIVTNSQGIEEEKDPEVCNIFALYKLFSTQKEQDLLAERYRAGGLGWGHAKQELFEKLDSFLTPYRDNYNKIIEDKVYIDKILLEGADKAKEITSKTIMGLREISGLL